VLAAATVQPAAVRYLTPGGAYCRAPAYEGDTTLMQTLRAMAAEKGIVAQVTFLDPIAAQGHRRRELACLSEAAIRRALGLDGADTPPGTPADLPGATR
jgi:1-acyl-sn-glycerol-3-phosphate acyltransferase